MQPGPAFGDVIGGLTIAGGISAALYHRQRTGEALVVDNSLLATSMWATGASSLAAGLFGFSRMPRGDRRKTPNPIVGNYRTSDGRFLSLVMLESDRYWPDLVNLLGAPELAEDPRFIDARARAENSVERRRPRRTVRQEDLEEWSILSVAKGVWARCRRPPRSSKTPKPWPTVTCGRSRPSRGRRFGSSPHPCNSTRRRRISPAAPTTGSTPTKSWENSVSTPTHYSSSGQGRNPLNDQVRPSRPGVGDQRVGRIGARGLARFCQGRQIGDG